MNNFEAKILINNLLQRIVAEADGVMKLPGAFTSQELEALHVAISALESTQEANTMPSNRLPPLPSGGASMDENYEVPTATAATVSGKDELIGSEPELDLEVLTVGPVPENVRLCLDFGTAMSKATLIDDSDGSIHVLPLGEYGEQDVIGQPIMLISSIYIDSDGLLWFGQQAIERSLDEDEDGSRDRIDSVKASVSDGWLHIELNERQNPTDHRVTYEDMVLANLMFLTWAVNHCVEALNYPRNVLRRFAMPCLSGEREQIAIQSLTCMLGQAQILADTYFQALPTGIPLVAFLGAAKQLRNSDYEYAFIGNHLTEPMGVAGSRMSFSKDVRTVFMVIDVGAGTTDFGLFKVVFDTKKQIAKAVEAQGSNLAITEAGNHLDELLMHYVLSKSQVDAENPIWTNLSGALKREIRSFKETLFRENEVIIPLFNSATVEVKLQEFLDLEPVQQFEKDIKETIKKIFEVVDSSWIRSIPDSRLGVILTGGGAQLPMIRKAANDAIMTRHGMIKLQEAIQFPNWMAEDYPELEDDYPRIAVSLGGAREHLVEKVKDAKITAGDIKQTPTLGGYFVTGESDESDSTKK